MPLILGIVASGNYPRVTNSYESIATTTVGAGGTSTITFSSIPSTFKHLQVRLLARGTNASNSVDVFIKYNGSTSTYYRGHQLYGEGTTAYASADSATGSGYAAYIQGSANTASAFGAAVIDILDYANTNKNKTVRWLQGYDTNGTVAGYGGFVDLISGSWMNTAAINSITLEVDGSRSYTQYSQFTLYGVR